MDPILERRLLQAAIAVAGLVPVSAGLAGAVLGLTLFDDGAVIDTALDSHGRYLSGLLAGIGFGFWSCIPRIVVQGGRFRLLAAIVVVGGLARLLAVVHAGWPGPGMTAALVMELIVTPSLALWRERVEAAVGGDALRR